MKQAENVKQQSVSLVAGLQFRFLNKILIGKPGMHKLMAPGGMGESVECPAFFHYPDGGMERDSLGELDVSNSSLIVLGKFDNKFVCRFAAVMNEGKRLPKGHRHILLVISFNSPFREFMDPKQIEVLRQLQLSYSLGYQDPEDDVRIELAWWLART